MKILFVAPNPANREVYLKTIDIWSEIADLEPMDEIAILYAHSSPALPSVKDADGMDIVKWHSGKADLVVAMGMYVSSCMDSRNIRHLRMPAAHYLDHPVHMECMMNLLKNVVIAERQRNFGVNNE